MSILPTSRKTNLRIREQEVSESLFCASVSPFACGEGVWSLLSWGWETGHQGAENGNKMAPRGPRPARGLAAPFQFPQRPGMRGSQGQAPLGPPLGVRDDDTSPVASSFLFLASRSSHPNSYSFPQTKALSRREDSGPRTSSRGSGDSGLCQLC